MIFTGRPTTTTTRANTEQAVKMPGHKKFHRLQPNGLIGTLRCGAGFRHQAGTVARWRPVGEVLPSQRCQECWKKASS